MNDLAVRLAGVTKRYRHFTLDGIDLELPTGAILGFIGANGAGKSTTLRILMGLVCQDRGTVEVLGHPMPAQEVAAKRNVGYVSEDLRLYKAATLAWHAAFVRSIYPGWDEAYRSAGATVRSVDPMTLEEIFVTDVRSRREGRAA
jgi:ABC-2 type transport system ATP-binding protein